MRPIKFRLWDYANKKFLGNWDKENFYLDIDSGVVYKLKGYTRKGFFLRYKKEELEPLKSIKISQSTGMFDKNGKEIFEGDIVKNTNQTSMAYKDVTAVLYNEIIGGFTVYFKDIEQYKKLGSFDSLEVVGNIYETPEYNGEAQENKENNE